MKRICAIMPSYNEEKNITNVIDGVLGQGLDAIVIDDGSSDKTFNLAKENGAFVIKHDRKKGKGASIKDGLTYALEKDYDYIMTIDADGQHNPKEIPLFINTANSDEKIGIVIGNRLENPGRMPAIRFYTNKIMSKLITILCGQKIEDTQCGYKLIKKDVLNVISIRSRKFEVESELLIKAAKANFKIKSIPISSIYAGEKSRINPFTDTIRFIRFIIKTIFQRLL